QYAPLIGFSRPWSPGTNGAASGQPILAVIQSQGDMEKFKGKLKGKIVLIDPVRRLEPQTVPLGRTYSDADLARVVFALLPSISTYNSDLSGTAERTAPGPPQRGEAVRRFRDRLNRFLTEEGVMLTIVSSRRTDGGTILASGAGSQDEKRPPAVPSV